MGLRVRHYNSFPGSICSFREGEQRARQGAHQTSTKTAPRSVIISAIELIPQFKARYALRSAAQPNTGRNSRKRLCGAKLSERCLTAAIRLRKGKARAKADFQKTFYGLFMVGNWGQGLRKA